MPEKKERKPPVTLYDVNARVKELENKRPTKLEDLIFNADHNDLAYLRSKVEEFAPKPKPVVRWPRLLVAFVLGCYCMALGLTVWYPQPKPDDWYQHLSEIGLQEELKPAPAVTYSQLQDPPSVQEPLVKTDPKHLSISNTGQHPCWVGVLTPDGRKVIYDFLNPEATVGTDDHPVTVRDSCPGELTFERDGKMVHPTPEAGHRHDVEVVAIP
jgi:hypothetical protein